MIRTTVIAAGLMAAAAGMPVFAQGFDSGSDGSDGAFFVPGGERVVLDLPPDGIFHFTSVTVEAGAFVKFNRNPLNTPVYILATRDIMIAGSMDVNATRGTNDPPLPGIGVAGGHDGGMPSFGASIPPGAGHGPGAGIGGATGGTQHAGNAGYGTARSDPNDGGRYGSALLVPMAGGSGGGGTTGQPGWGGGGGGGALLLASSTRIDVPAGGVLQALGAKGYLSTTGSGSGGAIRIVAPVVIGTGTIDVGGGAANANAGRIRIDTIDRANLGFAYRYTNVTSIGTFMVVFPNDFPKLDIIAAADEIISEGTPEPVRIFLPFGADPLRTVTVQARNFTGLVPIAVVLTPESGDPILYEAEIDMDTGDPAEVIVDVELPINTLTYIQAWTR